MNICSVMGVIQEESFREERKVPSCSERKVKSSLGSCVGYWKELMLMGTDNPLRIKVPTISLFLLCPSERTSAHLCFLDAAVLDVQTTWRVLTFLESIGADEQVLDGFRQKAAEVFPLSTLFTKKSREEEDKIRKGLLIPSWGAVEDAEGGGKEEN